MPSRAVLQIDAEVAPDELPKVLRHGGEMVGLDLAVEVTGDFPVAFPVAFRYLVDGELAEAGQVKVVGENGVVAVSVNLQHGNSSFCYAGRACALPVD